MDRMVFTDTIFDGVFNLTQQSHQVLQAIFFDQSLLSSLSQN